MLMDTWMKLQLYLCINIDLKLEDLKLKDPGTKDQLILPLLLHLFPLLLGIELLAMVRGQ